MDIAKYADQPSLGLAPVRGQTDPYLDKAGAKSANGRRCLFTGGPAGTPGNYMLYVGISDHDTGYHPRHRHACDQVRFAISGEVEFAPGKKIPEGSVGFFPAGTYYGPYEGSVFIGPDLIVCQFEGAHPCAYVPVNSAEMRDAIEELKKTGEYKNGVYTWYDQNGKKHNKDGYEAAHEKVTGSAIVYPPPRYQEPIVINPANFRAVPAGTGASIRELGQYTEAQTRLATVSIGAGGAYTLAANERTMLAVVTRGTASVGDTALVVRDGLRLGAHERIELRSEGGAELFVLELPRVNQA